MLHTVGNGIVLISMVFILIMVMVPLMQMDMALAAEELKMIKAQMSERLMEVSDIFDLTVKHTYELFHLTFFSFSAEGAAVSRVCSVF